MIRVSVPRAAAGTLAAFVVFGAGPASARPLALVGGKARASVDEGGSAPAVSKAALRPQAIRKGPDAKERRPSLRPAAVPFVGVGAE